MTLPTSVRQRIKNKINKINKMEIEEAGSKGVSDTTKALGAAGLTAAAGATLGHFYGADMDSVNDQVADNELQGLKNYKNDFDFERASTAQNGIDLAQDKVSKALHFFKSLNLIDKDNPADYVDSKGELTMSGQNALAQKLSDNGAIDNKTALKIVKDILNDPDNFKKYLSGEDFYNLKAIAQEDNPEFRHIERTGINFLDNLAFDHKLTHDHNIDLLKYECHHNIKQFQ
jgi:hypothetical protein